MKKLLLMLSVLLFLLAVAVSAFSIANLFDNFFSPPAITDAYLSLEKVIPGDELIITITAEDTFGIKEVTAEIEHERGTDKIKFSLISGSSKKGTWEGIWNVHDTIEKKLYKAEVTVVNRHNAEAKIELTFEDPVVSHTPDQITPQGAGSGLDSDQVDAFHAADLLAQGGGNSGLVFKRAFVTSTAYNGNLGGLAGADAKCQARADAASLGGTWRAILSSGSIDAIDRVGYKWDVLVNMQGGIIAIWPRAAATVAANGQTDLWNDALLRPIKYDEFGNYVSNKAWTGTNGYSGSTGGTAYGATCVSWTMASGDGVVGAPTYADSNWIANTVLDCENNNRIYCIEQ